jgi:hypothetical protein
LSEDHNWEFDTVRGSSFASTQVDEDSDAHEGPSTIRDYASSNLPSSLRLLFGDAHTGEVVSSHGSGIFLAEGNLGSSATAQSPKTVGGSLVDNGPKDDLDLASPAAFQFPVNSKQVMPHQSTSRVTQRQASPTPHTTVNHPNTHQNALSLDTSSKHDLPLVPRTRSATTPPPMLNTERDFLTSTHKTPNPIDRTLRLNSSGKLLNLGTPGLKDVLKVSPLLQAAVRLLI